MGIKESRETFACTLVNKDWLISQLAAAVIRKVRALSGFIGFKGSCRAEIKRVVKCRRPTSALQRELVSLSTHKVGGIRGVAVKCLDITKNSDCEGNITSANDAEARKCGYRTGLDPG